MSSGSFSQQPQVQTILDNCRRQIRNNALLAGASSVCLVVVAGLLLAAGLDYLLPLPSVVRAGLLVALISAVVYVTYRNLFQPLRSQLSDQQLGAAVDLSAPELQESLATLISIESPEATKAEAGSDVMRRHLQKHVSKRITQAVPSEVVDLTSTRKRCGVAGLVICLAMVPVVLWPSISALLLNRLVSPFQNLSTVSNLYFEVADANRTVARLSDVEIVAVPKWRDEQSNDLPESVQLILTSNDGAIDSLSMLFDETQSAYVAVVSSISGSVDFRVSAPEVTTEVFRLNVVDRPIIQTAVMVDSPPIYTGRAVQTFDGMLGDMEVFEGSLLEIELTFNKPVSEAKLIWLGRDPMPVAESDLEEIKHDAMTGEEVILLDEDPDAPLGPEMIDIDALPTEQLGTLGPDGLSARFEFTAEAGGDFEFEISDEHRLLNIVGTSRHLTVTYDQPPQLKVGGMIDGDRFRPDDIVPLNCLAADDIGLGEVQLHYRIDDEVERIIPASDFEAGSLLTQTSFRIPLADLDVKDGSVIRLRVKAADERPTPGPQVAWSDMYSVTIDSNATAAGADALQAESEGMIAALKLLEKLLLEDEKKSRELSKQIRQEFSDESRAETERLSEKEQQQGSILQKLAEQVATHPLMKESADKLQELGEQLRQAVPDTLEEAANNERKEASRKMDDAAKQIQDVRNDLGREIKNIEKAARLEQELAELNRLALQADQLSKDSEQLDQDRQQAEAKPDELTEEEWNERLQDRQEGLQQKQQDLTEDIERLLRQQDELRKAAQNAQKQKLMELAEEVQKLADQQNAVAEGTQEEAREVGREANAIANELEQVRQEAQKLNQQVERLDDTQLDDPQGKPDTQRLQQAIQELRKGNLDDSRENVAKAAEETKQLKQQLNGEQPPAAARAKSDEAAKANGDEQTGEQQAGEQNGGEQPGDQQPSNEPPGDQSEKNAQADQAKQDAQQQSREQASENAQQVEDKLQSIEQRIQQLQSEKNLNSSTTSETGQPTEAERETSNAAGDPPHAQHAEGQQSDDPASQPGTGSASPQSAQPAAAQKPADNPTEQDQQVQAILSELQNAVESAQKLSESAAGDSAADSKAKRSASDSVERAEQGLQQAAAGRFNEAAKQLSRASSSASSASRQLDDESQQAEQQQAESLSQDLGRLAENLQGLQQDDASQIAAQQQTQSEVAQEAGQLPERLQELQETLEIPALQMQDQAQQTGRASKAAEQAADTSEQAAINLDQGNLQQAGLEGRQTAQKLQEVAEAARRASQQGGQQPSDVPNDVGQSVADALQQLQQAADAMQQSQQGQPASEGQSPSGPPEPGAQPGQPSDAEAGDGDSGQQPSDQQSGEQGEPSDSGSPNGPPSSSGQPSPNGQPKSGSKPLSDAAKSLAQAAKQSLPGQHRPSDPSNTNSQASSDAGNGSAALWNGLMPNSSAAVGTGKNWGQLVDELDTNTSGAMGTSRDTEYEALIRMYFREVAKATGKGK